jgi:tetratricopeptide (TPR) repeat protein
MGIFGRKKDLGTLLNEGLAFLDAGKTDKAAARLREVVKSDPRHAHAWFCLGTVHSGLGQHESAIDCYRQSAEHAPADKRALPLFNMGNALQTLGRLDEALKVFELTTQADPEMADGWINRGRLLDDAGHHADAIDCYDKALALAPDDVTALANRGNSLRSLERFDDARASYEAALALEPDNIAGLIGLALCLAALGRPEEGLRFADKAVAESGYPPALAERALILAQLKRYDEALTSIGEAIRAGFDTAPTYHNRGEILALAGRLDDAIESFDEALKREPRYVPALFGKARALCNAQRYGPAKAAIDVYFACSDETDRLRTAANALVFLCREAGVQ